MMKLNKKQLWAPLTMILLVSTIVVITLTLPNLTSASPGTYIYVDPSEVRDVASGNSFQVHINVSEAPSTYAWYIKLKWDPDLLELVEAWDPIWEEYVNVTEGSFLDRRYWTPFGWVKEYATSVIHDPVDEANAAGEIMIGCTLIGSVTWASGDGWLCSLNFTVEDTGSSVLDLYRTRLNDHYEAGYPAPTYYPNLDGFFSNVDIHDVAVASVTVNTTSVVPGEAVSINVTAENEGDYSENFTVTVYADAVVYDMSVDWWPDVIVVGDEVTIGTQTVNNLAIGTNTTLTFTWDTTDVAAETYYVSAKVALTSPADDDPRDNLLIDGTVAFTVGHDLKIHDITIVTPEVIKGELANMSVTVLNQGTSSESFNLYVNASNININSTSDSLSAGANSTYNISWNTTGVAGGIYTISAYVPPVTGEREVDKADNLKVDGTVKVVIHDMNVTGIKAYTTAVYLNWAANLTVTVLNEGTATENYWLYVYANRTKSTRSPSSTSGGWTNGAGAYADGTTYASITSGTPSANQSYGGYGFVIPAGATISKVRVRLDAWTVGNEYLNLTLSGNGGTSWLTSQWNKQLTTGETTYWVDVTAWTGWKPANFTGDKIRTRVWAVTDGSASEVRLDWIPIEVTYTYSTILAISGSLAPGASKIHEISWDTTSAAFGWYNITAYVIPHPAEVDTADNTRSNAWVHVLIPGDCDGDGDVDSTDLGILAGRYGQSE